MGVLARILGCVRALAVEEAELLIAAVEPALTDSNGREIGRVEITVAPPAATVPTKAGLGFWMAATPVEPILEFFNPPRR
jgi:hypothetical protein